MYTMAFPLTGRSRALIQRGYMIWDSPRPAAEYGGSLATCNYLYNPSTVASDYNDRQRQRPGRQWTTPTPATRGPGHPDQPDRPVVADVRPDVRAVGATTRDGTPEQHLQRRQRPDSIGVQADVMQFMQFTGMFISSQLTPNGQGGLTADRELQRRQTGIMQRSRLGVLRRQQRHQQPDVLRLRQRVVSAVHPLDAVQHPDALRHLGELHHAAVAVHPADAERQLQQLLGAADGNRHGRHHERRPTRARPQCCRRRE